jgi:hypothetical protein
MDTAVAIMLAYASVRDVDEAAAVAAKLKHSGNRGYRSESRKGKSPVCSANEGAGGERRDLE